MKNAIVTHSVSSSETRNSKRGEGKYAIQAIKLDETKVITSSNTKSRHPFLPTAKEGFYQQQADEVVFIHH